MFGPQATEWRSDSLELCVITESGMMEDVAVIGVLLIVIALMLRYATPTLLCCCWHPLVLMKHSEHDTMELLIMYVCASWQETLFLII